MIRIAITSVLIIIAAYAGVRFEATKIQQTCEDQNSPTVLNGTAYVCLTEEQALRIRKALDARGA